MNSMNDLGLWLSSQWEKLRIPGPTQGRISPKIIDFLAYPVILLFSIASLANALRFAPADGDDLRILSTVIKTSNPLTYFFSDWGLGGTAMYRPLHSIGIWLSYHAFGVFPAFDQLLNLLIHATVIWLIYRLLRHSGSTSGIALLISALAIASPYTLSPATWISDRPTLIVSLFLMILLNYLYSNLQSRKNPQAWIVTLLCIGGLMGKESGLILPAFVATKEFISSSRKDIKIRNILLGFSIVGFYILFRLILFGPKAANYSESGYIFGWIHYSSLNQLPSLIKYWVYIDNFIKIIISIVFPVFDWEGGFHSPPVLINTLPLWIATFLLVSLSTVKKLSPLQKAAILIIVLNSFIHIALFRYRIQYISFLAFCLYIGSSNIFYDSSIRKRLSVACALWLLLTNLTMARRDLIAMSINKRSQLNREGLANLVQKYPAISNDAINKLITKYKL